MKQDGFTLIEVIITIVMVSAAGLMILSFFNLGLTRSADPLQILDDNFQVVRAIEIVNADYRTRLENDPDQDIGFYVSADLSASISGLAGVSVSGQYTDFTNPDASRRVSEQAAGGTSMFVKITAVRNQSRLVTILGN